jgi:hypothetical protein
MRLLHILATICVSLALWTTVISTPLPQEGKQKIGDDGDYGDYDKKRPRREHEGTVD